MVKNHMLRMAAPYSWPVVRKVVRFISRPAPGAHSMEESMSVLVFVRDILKLASSTKEVRFLLNNKKVIVDGRVVRERTFPVGFMDILTIKDLNKHYRVLLNKKGKLRLQETDEKQAKFKIAKITGKRNLAKDKEQISLYDGKNFIAKTKMTVGDSIVFDFEKGPGEMLEMKKGAAVYLTGGSHTDFTGTVSEIFPKKAAEDEIVVDSAGTKIRTLKKYAFVIGKEKPYINTE